MAYSHEFIAVATDRAAFLTEQRNLLLAENRAFEGDIHRLEELHGRNRRETSSYLLAEVSDPELAALEERLRYPRLLTIKRSFEEELAKVQARITQAEADPRIQHHAFHTTQVEDELKEIQDAYQHVQRRLDMWTTSHWFEELDGRGYFSRDYDPGLMDRFWDWRAISYLMEEMEELHDLLFPTPEAIRDAWTALKAEADPIVELWNDLQARLKSLMDLKARYDALKARPNELFLEMYNALGEAVLDHLESCPEELRVELAAGDKHLATFLKKDAGLTKQLEYLRQLRVTRIQPLMQSLDTELSKLNRKIAKARRKSKY